MSLRSGLIVSICIACLLGPFSPLRAENDPAAGAESPLARTRGRLKTSLSAISTDIQSLTRNRPELVAVQTGEGEWRIGVMHGQEARPIAGTPPPFTHDGPNAWY